MAKANCLEQNSRLTRLRTKRFVTDSLQYKYVSRKSLLIPNSPPKIET